MTRPKPLVLIILDGWGYRAETKANAIAMARKPTYDRLLGEYPNTLIHTSGKYGRLPCRPHGQHAYRIDDPEWRVLLEPCAARSHEERAQRRPSPPSFRTP